MKPSEVLDRAADLITPEGAWVQGRYGITEDDDAPNLIYRCFCIFGAVDQVAGNAWQSPAWPYLVRALDNVLPQHFNDAPGRTQSEVVAALRKAAELARSEGQ